MSHLQYYAYPGWGEWATKNSGFKQAVKIGNVILCSGQGGWDGSAKDFELDTVVTADLEGEVALAFENVERCLRDCGASWDNVYKIVTYSTDIPAQMGFIVANMSKWMPSHQPIWTELSVPHLGSKSMHIEIDVEAHVPESRKAM